MNTVKIRRHRWCFEDVGNRDWLAGSAAVSRWFDVYTLLVPDNESFYIRTLRQCTVDAAIDEFDSAELFRFFRQESLHGIAHRAYWRKMRDLGIEYSDFLRFINWVLYSVVEPKQCLRIRISMVAAIEHVNACLGNTVLKGDLFVNATGSLRKMFYWHFAEEIEHKAVAHKVLDRLYPGYFNRIFGALIAFPAFFCAVFVGTAYLLSKEGKFLTRRTATELFKFWIRDGVLKDLAFHLCRYFRTSFEPWELNDHHLASSAELPIRRNSPLSKSSRSLSTLLRL
ncbi:MAG: metal-dependent hydrolase [Gammaproteobacteria bacterium]|nr:metal-dependent hydrolase [Gammaproteobacteria bacterium]